ncbi:MAG: hypothetical protein ACLQJ0_20825 [Steroidobacteraceae bacterium]
MRERAFPISHRPLVLVPIAMAGESPSLFALGLGDGVGPCRVYVCAEPRNRDQQYALLRKVAADIEQVVAGWQTNPVVMPQIITSSRAALRLVLATFHRMTYTTDEPMLQSVGRKMHWFDRVFEQTDSGALLDMPAALGALYATGQDDHADSHLGALLEWLKPADGRIYDRILEAEAQPVSTSTDPRVDNDELVPRVEQLAEAERQGDTRTVTQLRNEVSAIFRTEVERRYRLIQEALAICLRFPASDVADHMEREDRGRHDRHQAYVANPDNRLAAGLTGDAATATFLSRELNSEHIERMGRHSLSGAQSAARLSGDILAGEVIHRDAQKIDRRLHVHYQIRTAQERSPLRVGDKLTPVDSETFGFVVLGTRLENTGHTIVDLELKDGKTKPGQPEVGDQVELAEPRGSMEGIARTMGLAHERLRSKPARRAIAAPVPVTHNYLAGVRALRRNP